MGLFGNHNSISTQEEKELIKGATPYLNEKVDRKQLPRVNAPEGLVDFDEGFKKPQTFVGVDELSDDYNHEDHLINEIDRRMAQSRDDKAKAKAEKN